MCRSKAIADLKGFQGVDLNFKWLTLLVKSTQGELRESVFPWNFLRLPHVALAARDFKFARSELCFQILN